MLIEILSTVVIVYVLVLLTILVVGRKQNSHVFAFSVFLILSILWQSAHLFALRFDDASQIYWVRVTISLAAFWLGSLMYLANNIPNKIYQSVVFWIYLLTSVLFNSIAALTDMVFIDIIKNGNETVTTLGVLFPIYAAIQTLNLLIVFHMMMRQLRLAKSNDEKQSSKIIQITTYISFVAIFCLNFILPIAFNKPQATLLSPVFVGLLLYGYIVAILRFGLYGVSKELVQNYLYYTTLVIVYSVPLFGVTYFFESRFDEISALGQSIIYIILILTTILSARRISYVFKKNTDKVFGRHRKDLQYSALLLKEVVSIQTAKLRSQNQKKDEFISIASHQLRNPITAAKLNIDMLLRNNDQFTEQQFASINSVRHNILTMGKLVDELLEVARISQGEYSAKREVKNLSKIVEKQIDSFKPKANDLGVTLHCDISKNVFCEVDSTKISEVISNMIDNAINYSAKNGTVNVTLNKTSSKVIFEVIDNGIGVPESDKSKIFEKFERAANAKNAQPDGTGLGLFLCKKIIELHKGRIIFKSIEGAGSTFGFELDV